jgi:hypothetical protein
MGRMFEAGEPLRLKPFGASLDAGNDQCWDVLEVIRKRRPRPSVARLGLPALG